MHILTNERKKKNKQKSTHKKSHEMYTIFVANTLCLQLKNVFIVYKQTKHIHKYSMINKFAMAYCAQCNAMVQVGVRLIVVDVKLYFVVLSTRLFVAYGTVCFFVARKRSNATRLLYVASKFNPSHAINMSSWTNSETNCRKIYYYFHILMWPQAFQIK